MEPSLPPASKGCEKVIFFTGVHLFTGGYSMVSGPRSVPWSLVPGHFWGGGGGGTPWSCHMSCPKSCLGDTPVLLLISLGDTPVLSLVLPRGYLRIGGTPSLARIRLPFGKIRGQDLPRKDRVPSGQDRNTPRTPSGGIHR